MHGFPFYSVNLNLFLVWFTLMLIIVHNLGQYLLTQRELHCHPTWALALRTGSPFHTNTLLTLHWFLSPTPQPLPLSSSWCELLPSCSGSNTQYATALDVVPFHSAWTVHFTRGCPRLGILLILLGLQLRVFSYTDALLILLSSDTPVMLSLPIGFRIELARKRKGSTFFWSLY